MEPRLPAPLTAPPAMNPPVMAPPPSASASVPSLPGPQGDPVVPPPPPTGPVTQLGALADTSPFPVFTASAGEVIDDTKNAGALPIVASLLLFFAGAALNLPLLWPVGLVTFIVGLVIRSRTRKRAVQSLSAEDSAVAKSSLKKARLIVLAIVVVGALRFAIVEILVAR